MEKPKKKEPARLVVELSSRERLQAIHRFVRRTQAGSFRSTAEWARAVLVRECGGEAALR